MCLHSTHRWMSTLPMLTTDWGLYGCNTNCPGQKLTSWVSVRGTEWTALMVSSENVCSSWSKPRVSDACSKPHCKAARFVFLILVRKASWEYRTQKSPRSVAACSSSTAFSIETGTFYWGKRLETKMECQYEKQWDFAVQRSWIKHVFK